MMINFRCHMTGLKYPWISDTALFLGISMKVLPKTGSQDMDPKGEALTLRCHSLGWGPGQNKGRFMLPLGAGHFPLPPLGIRTWGCSASGSWHSYQWTLDLQVFNLNTEFGLLVCDAPYLGLSYTSNFLSDATLRDISASIPACTHFS